jgi:ubiquitin C-terminal hydrolase
MQLAKKTLRLEHIPKHAVIQLKRWRARKLNDNQIIYEKIFQPVHVELELNMARFKPVYHRRSLDNELIDDYYDLYAFIVHEGANANSGHYFSYCRNPYSGVWHRFDDLKYFSLCNKIIIFEKDSLYGLY